MVNLKFVNYHEQMCIDYCGGGMTGLAQTWFLNLKHRYRTYFYKFKAKFFCIYVFRRRTIMYDDLFKMDQKKNEAVLEYSLRLKRSIARTDPHMARETRLSIFRKGLRPELKEYVMLNEDKYPSWSGHQSHYLHNKRKR